MRKLLVVLALGVLASLALAACGGDDNETTATTATTPTTATTTGGGGGGGGGGATVNVSADPSGALKFEESTLSAPAGTDAFKFTNDAPVQHDFCIEGADPECTELVSGGSETLTVDLKPGSYTYYCSVPGHRESGMEGTLTVK